MELHEYQTHALKTALPRALDLDYLVPMIIGEIGELFGQKAKAHRDGWTPDQLQTELISEYGDIAWGTAVLLHLEGVTEAPYQYPALPDPFAALLSGASRLYAGYQRKGPDWPDEAAEIMWMTLREKCLAITGRGFDYVLAANVDKLARRAAAGRLMGSGDHR